MSREKERAELHRTIWQIANDLRGSVAGWDFKEYILGMLFYRFISENLTAFLNAEEHKAGNAFNYMELSDKQAVLGRESTVSKKGFFILPSQLFENVRIQAHEDTKQEKNLNETLVNVFKAIENSANGSPSESNWKGLFADIDVDSNKLGTTMQQRSATLLKIMDGIAQMDLGVQSGDISKASIDSFGDAYEYLMTMYASTAGKKGGEFFTPQEVSELLARLTVEGKTELNKVYDPACGSGSLLLKFNRVIGRENIHLGFFGQESNIVTYNLCRYNMFLHNIGFEKFHIAHGDTLISPQHWDDQPFDAIVSNPPYSIRWEGEDNPLLVRDPRFTPAGVLAPKSKADLAFTMHILAWLSTVGTAAIVEFPGILYRGGAEEKIRKYLVENNYVDAVIQLPPDLFFGTSITTCIIVLKKSKKANNILFIDATTECVRSGNKNKLSEENRNKILDAFRRRENIPHFARVISNKEIAANAYTLSVSSYFEEHEGNDAVNIHELNAHIAQIVSHQSAIRKELDDIIADIENISVVA